MKRLEFTVFVEFDEAVSRKDQIIVTALNIRDGLILQMDGQGLAPEDTFTTYIEVVPKNVECKEISWRSSYNTHKA